MEKYVLKDEIDLTLDEDDENIEIKNENDIKIKCEDNESKQMNENKAIRDIVNNDNEKNEENSLEPINAQPEGNNFQNVGMENINVKANNNPTYYSEDEPEIKNLIELTVQTKDGRNIYIFSCGPIPKYKNDFKRPISCHACRFTTFSLNRMKTHIKRESHQSKILAYLEKKNICIYIFYNWDVNGAIKFCIFAGENIPQVDKIMKDRLMRYCRSQNGQRMVYRLMMNATTLDKIIDVNNRTFCLGVEYCIKFSDNTNFFCTLCNKELIVAPILHCSKKLHINNFIVRHFLLTKNHIVQLLLNNNICDAKEIDEIVAKIIIEVSQDFEFKCNSSRITITSQVMFKSFRNMYVKSICNFFHISEQHILRSTILNVTKKYILKKKQQSPDAIITIDDESNEAAETNEIRTSISEMTSTRENPDLNNRSKIDYYILDSEKKFQSLEIIKHLQILNDPIENNEGPDYWKKPIYSLEYIFVFQKLVDNNAVLKYKCFLCNNFFETPVVQHAVSAYHRMQYINKHFPNLKYCLTKCLSDIKFNNEQKTNIIGQMIAELCLQLQNRTNIKSKKIFKVSCANDNRIETFDYKKFFTQLQYDDQFFISVYKTMSERSLFLTDLINKFLNYYKVESRKRKNTNDLTLENNMAKRNKNICTDRFTLKMIAVLNFVKDSVIFRNIKSKTTSLLAQARDLMKITGNLSVSEITVEFATFFKGVLRIINNFKNSDAYLSANIPILEEINDDCIFLINSIKCTNLKEPFIMDILTIDDNGGPETINPIEPNNSSNSETEKTAAQNVPSCSSTNSSNINPHPNNMNGQIAVNSSASRRFTNSANYFKGRSHRRYTSNKQNNNHFQRINASNNASYSRTSSFSARAINMQPTSVPSYRTQTAQQSSLPISSSILSPRALLLLSTMRQYPSAQNSFYDFRLNYCSPHRISYMQMLTSNNHIDYTNRMQTNNPPFQGMNILPSFNGNIPNYGNTQNNNQFQ